MSYNLGSKNNIKNPVNCKNLSGWFKNEISDLPHDIQEIFLNIFLYHASLCKFPEKNILLLENCDRTKPKNAKQKIHKYSEIIKEQAKQKGIKLDTRPNGPAIAAFEFAGGIRPLRHGSSNKWSIHHIYSGKFPYIGKYKTLHATKDGRHFTQAVGLVALHPLADALADECPAFTWFLRYKAYEKFGYDPDCAFSKDIDEYGFNISWKGTMI